MQRAGLFWKLFLSTALLCIALAATLLLVFSSAWRRSHIEQFELRLSDSATLLGELLSEDWPRRTTPQLAKTLQQIEGETGVRLTVIAASGDILGDSASESAGAAPEGENIASRVEIVQAAGSRAGWATRRREGDLEPVRYCAIAVQRDGVTLGYVRAAMPIAQRDAEMARGERRLWLLGFVTLLLGIGTCYAIATFTMRPLVAIQEAAEAIASGDYQRRLPYVSRAHDEISRAAQSLYEVGQRLASREPVAADAGQVGFDDGLLDDGAAHLQPAADERRAADGLGLTDVLEDLRDAEADPGTGEVGEVADRCIEDPGAIDADRRLGSGVGFRRR